MRLTLRTNRWTHMAVLAAWVSSSGCQRLPYIDQSKSVPHDNMGKMALEDKEVKQADFLTNSLPLQLPKVAKPRTTNDPEAEEIWPMTLQEAIRIGLDNSEVVRVIPFGAQGIPIGGFEPSPLNTGAGGRHRRFAGCGVAAVGLRPGDPGNPDRPGAERLRHGVHDQLDLGQEHVSRSTTPSRAVRSNLAGTKTPVISIQDTAKFQTGLQKRTATGAQLGIVAQRELALPEQHVPGDAVGLHDQPPDDSQSAFDG